MGKANIVMIIINLK